MCEFEYKVIKKQHYLWTWYPYPSLNINKFDCHYFIYVN